MKQKRIDLVKEKLGRFANIIFIIMAILLAFSLFKSYLSTKKASLRIEETEKIVRNLEERNTMLREELEIVESEDYAEKQLRDKLGLSKEGEIVVILPDDEVLKKLAPEVETEEESLPDPNWKRWLELFL